MKSIVRRLDDLEATYDTTPWEPTIMTIVVLAAPGCAQHWPRPGIIDTMRWIVDGVAVDEASYRAAVAARRPVIEDEEDGDENEE